MAISLDRNFWHLVVRLAGLAGLMAAVIGLVIMLEYDDAAGLMVLVAGGVLAGIALAVELAALGRLAMSRRSAVGGNVLLQVVLALAVLAGINVFSFFNYQRFDWTVKREFTLDPKLRDELAKLRAETTIVVLQRHAASGQQHRQDNYDSAADRKIVEKVRDLVEQFQQIGARFRVRYLDIDQENYEDQLADLKKLSPALGEAIENTPENSIFFFTKESAAIGQARESIQRLSFADIYQLDREASQQANDKRGNLVLKYQGAGPFARKILNIEEKRPRIAVAAVFDSDTMEGSPPYGMGGVKKSLAAHGFESRDIVLKREGRPNVLTYEESKFERLEAKVAQYDLFIEETRRVLDALAEERKDFERAMANVQKLTSEKKTIDEPLAELNKKYGFHYVLEPIKEGDRVLLRPRQQIRPRKDGERIALRDITLKELKTNLEEFEDLDFDLDYLQNRRKELGRQLAVLNADELTEKRRLTDLKSKFERTLADCDLVIIPRLTLVDVTKRDNYAYSTYRLESSQVEAIKSFMKAGKPVLFCLSPPFDEKDAPDDELDKLVTELGIRLGRDSVFYRADSEALAEMLADPEARGMEEPPPVELTWSKGTGMLREQLKFATGLIHPLRTSMRLGARVGPDQPFDLRLRHPRPVYAVKYPPEAAGAITGLGSGPTLFSLLLAAGQPVERIDDQATFLVSPADSWNEAKSFPLQGGRVPRYKRIQDDPHRGTTREKRRGPFPIAVAVETPAPASWFEEGAQRPKVRVAVVGHGGVFLGATLTPAKEKLLLDTCNWLLARDDLIARDKESWQFPRIQMEEAEQNLWAWGAMLVLPLSFAFFGTAMFLVRRMR